jgi:hypothetical protein
MTLQEIDWDTLVLSINQGHCILMLGPDAVTENADGEGLPLMELFAQTLREQLADKGAPPKQFNPAQVAQAYQAKFERNGLLAAAKRFFPGKNQPNQVLMDLAALPFKLIINTSPDLQMEEAFSKCDPPKIPRFAWYQVGAEKKDLVLGGAELEIDKPLVYYLYGCIRKLDSLVLSENDMLDFLVAVAKKKPPLPNDILSALKKNHTTFLFLGFGLKHWYLRILFHALEVKGTNRSYALEKFDAPFDNAVVESTVFFFQEGHKIHFFDMKLEEFTKELRKRIEEEGKTLVPNAYAPRPLDAPKAFLSYASEDVETAKKLSDRLREEGVQPLWDKEFLGPGERWNEKIINLIEREVDFFILLQSKSLVEKRVIEAYVNREIDAALERQKGFGDGSFIMPVLIEDYGLMEPKLDRFQRIDLRKEDDFKTLVQKIHREFQRRRKGRK